MGLFATVFGWIVVVFAGLGALVFAGMTLADLRHAIRVTTSSATPLRELAADQEDNHFVGTLESAPGPSPGIILAQVTDSFYYWLARDLAASSRTGTIGEFLLKHFFGTTDYRREADRRRASVVAPDTMVLADHGRNRTVSFAPGVRPLQRFEADGAFLPFVVLFVFVVGMAVAMLFPVAAVPAVILPIALKRYHDGSLLGGWDLVVPLDDERVPTAVQAAVETPDPPAHGICAATAVEPGERVRVAGDVAVTGDGRIRVTDGIVTTRGRWFVALATFVRFLKLLAITLAFGGVAVLFGLSLSGVL